MAAVSDRPTARRRRPHLSDSRPPTRKAGTAASPETTTTALITGGPRPRFLLPKKATSRPAGSYRTAPSAAETATRSRRPRHGDPSRTAIGNRSGGAAAQARLSGSHRASSRAAISPTEPTRYSHRQWGAASG